MLPNAARTVLILVLLSAPWWFGGATAISQFWLGVGVVLALGFWIPSLLLQRTSRPIPEVLLPICLILLVGVVQLVPLPGPPGLMHRAELADWLPGGLVAKPAGGAISIYPAATRHELCRLLLATAVLLMASDLFRTRLSRSFLCGAILLNGTALALFGIVQKLTWEGKMFGRVPIVVGQPFASFVNRNNAAGYLNLCLACGVGLLVLTYRSSRSDGQTRPIEERWEPFSNLDRLLPQWIVILLGTVTLAVFAASSRGGIVGLVSMAIAAMLLAAATRYRRLVFGGLVAMGVVTVLALGWLGFGRAVGERLSTLRQLEQISDARPVHWADSMRAVADFPWAGTGLAAYHYAHKPYQSHVSSGWYYNADSEYVEWLVEGGAIVAVAWLWLLVLLWLAAGRLIRSQHGVLDAGITLLLMLVGQSVQALTDFGISMSANQLLAAAICGMACGTTFRIQEHHKHPRMNMPMAPVWAFVLTALLVGGASALGLRELWTASRAYIIARETPDPSQFEQSQDFAIEIALPRTLKLLELRPDDADLHLITAKLYLHQLRQNLFQLLRNEAQDPLADTELWRRTQPSSLFLAALAVSGGGESSLDELIADPTARSQLKSCVEHLRRAQSACPLIPDADYLLGCLDLHAERRSIEAEWHFRRELCLSPTDLELLRRTANLAKLSGMTNLAVACWQRELQLDVGRTSDVLDVALPGVGESVVLDEILPQDSVAALVEFAERAGATAGCARSCQPTGRGQQSPGGPAPECSDCRAEWQHSRGDRTLSAGRAGPPARHRWSAAAQ